MIEHGRSVEQGEEPHPCVYLVFAQGLVKIGRTINLPKRISSLRSDDFPRGVKGFGPIEKTLFIKTNSPERLESKLHSLMEQERVTGEWFHLKEDDIDALKGIFDQSVGEFQNTEAEELSVQVYDMYHGDRLTLEQALAEEEEPPYWDPIPE